VECASDPKSAVTVYLNDLDKVNYLTPKNKQFYLKADRSQEVSSVKFNFGSNNNIAIKGITLFNVLGKPFAILPSRSVEGTSTASSTLKPERFYNIQKMFDSKLESGWSSDKKKQGDTLSFTFEESHDISALKIWSGYQRSEVHFKSNSRPKTMVLEDGGEYSQTITVKDEMGAQTITFPEKFSGRKLNIIIKGSYPGEKYADLVISELRFLENDHNFFINPLLYMKSNREYNYKQFSKGGFEPLLDAQLSWLIDGPDDSYMHLRLRSDGSFYRESLFAGEETSRKSFSLGNYEIKKVSEKRIDLRLFGYIVTQKGTGKFEGGDCGGYYSYVYKGSTKRIFTEYISIEPYSGKLNWGDQFILYNLFETGKKDTKTLEYTAYGVRKYEK